MMMLMKGPKTTIRSDGTDMTKKIGPAVYNIPQQTPKTSLPAQKAYMLLIKVIDIPTIPTRLATIKVERLLIIAMILGVINVPMIKPTYGIPLIIALFRSALFPVQPN